MKLAIMQPYFLPYIGYYALIKCVDHWIFNDEVQMINKGWVERNRILKQYGGWQYIRVPLHKHPHTEIIRNIRIRNNEEWQGKILAQLAHYKRKAPYYWDVVRMLSSVFEEEYDTITEINAAMLKQTCAYLQIDFEYEVLSKMDLDLTNIQDSDDWSLSICEQLNYDHYVNPILGKKFYDVEKYKKHHIKVNFLNMRDIHYEQYNDEFVDGLSIIDVMMFNPPEKVNKMLDEYELLD